MAVSAQSVKIDAQSATVAWVDLRGNGRAAGGSLVYEGERLTTGWHRHDLHQIEYAVHGAVEVETSGCTYLLPPHQAAWIPAGCAHQATLHASVTTISVLFEPSTVADAGDDVRILTASPLLREMVLHAVRWPITRRECDPAADIFFQTLGHLVETELEREAGRGLPTSNDPIVAAAIEYTQHHLASVTIADVCSTVGVSERTLRRRFADVLSMPWRTYLTQARILRSMALLAEPDRTVLGVAIAVGFENVSAFTRAFSLQTGETPTSYRRRASRG